MKVVGLGGGGHARVLIDALLLSSEHEIVGIVDVDAQTWGTRILGVPVLGGEELLPDLSESGIEGAFIGLGSTRAGVRRRALFQKLSSLGFQSIRIIHPRACLAASAQLGVGTMVLAGAIVNPGATVGTNVILNTGSIVEHDCRLDDHVHLSPGAVLSGHVWVGECAHVGAGATVREGIQIGAGAVVGAGSVVVRNIPTGETWAGVPARRLR